MSARELLIAAVAAKLRATSALAELSVFDAPPVRAALPYALVEEPVLADWSTKTTQGREGRIAVTLSDGGERPVRLRAVTAAVEEALADLDGAVGAGWRVVALVLARSRLARMRDERWVATSEFVVRMYRENG